MDGRYITILNRVESYMTAYEMLPAGAVVAVGVSGGADSMCLLHVLMSVQKRLGLSLCAVHINHGIRGDAADRDEAFVKAFCEENGVACRIYRGDIPEMARVQKLTLEEAGRKFRYACFEETLQDMLKEPRTGDNLMAGRIAVAHNKNDMAETFLMNVCRGTGLAGAASIPPVRDQVIRPLLCLEREEILHILSQAGISYCVDETNLTEDYARNRIRNEVLPYLIETINAQSVEHIFTFCADAARVSRYLKKNASELLTRIESPDGGLDIQQLKDLDEIMAEQVIREKLHAMTQTLKDISRVHVEEILRLIEKPVGKEVYLPYGIRVSRGYTSLLFTKTAMPPDPGEERKAAACTAPDTQQLRGAQAAPLVPGEEAALGMQQLRGAQAAPLVPGEEAALGMQQLRGAQAAPLVPGEEAASDMQQLRGARVAPPVPGGKAAPAGQEIFIDVRQLEMDGTSFYTDIPGSGKCMVFRVFFADENQRQRIPQNRYTKWFDCDKIAHVVSLRHRISGDYLTIDDFGRKKLLRRWMIDEKIPAKQRDEIWLLADQGHVLWVIGGRISSAYKVTAQTRRILEVRVTELGK